MILKKMLILIKINKKVLVEIELPDPGDWLAVKWMTLELYSKDKWCDDIIIEKEFCVHFEDTEADYRKKAALDWLTGNKIVDYDSAKGYKINILGRRFIDKFMRQFLPDNTEKLICSRINSDESRRAMNYYGCLDKARIQYPSVSHGIMIQVIAALFHIQSFEYYVVWVESIYPNVLDFFKFFESL